MYITIIIIAIFIINHHHRQQHCVTKPEQGELLLNDVEMVLNLLILVTIVFKKLKRVEK